MMPIFRGRTALDVARSWRAYLGLEAGVRLAPSSESGGLDRARELEKRDWQIARQRDEIQELKARLARQEESSGEGRFQTAGGRFWTSRQSVPVFFLVGAPKSGTGWLMKLLDAHPEVFCRGEGRFSGGRRAGWIRGAWRVSLRPREGRCSRPPSSTRCGTTSI